MIEDTPRKAGHISGTLKFNEKAIEAIIPGNVIKVEGHTSQINTEIALKAAINAIYDGKGATIFTRENTSSKLMGLILSYISGLSIRGIRNGDLNSDDQDKLLDGARRIHEFKDRFGVDQTPISTFDDLFNKCRQYQYEYGLDFIVIDFDRLMHLCSGGDLLNQVSRNFEISSFLEKLAKELKISVIALPCIDLEDEDDAVGTQLRN